MSKQKVNEHYNTQYLKKNYFGYQEWLYRPYVESMVSLTGLPIGSTILDVGCGQGFFSYLFHKCGLKVYGIDISETGIRLAQSTYGFLGIDFAVANVLDDVVLRQFDCVFVRSFSLYNTENFPTDNKITNKLLSYVKEGGSFIFAYNTKYSPLIKSESWRYHTLNQMKEHFLSYQLKHMYFVNKIDTLIMGKYAFNLPITKLNILLSKKLGFGGDLVCVLTKGKNPFVPHITEQ